ncbi:hypothetical protein Ari01nite_84870 [Paractinoplanes rishiriensis]|uniref:Uncharacterized protein n=1 Tax=Paractinoplanes rishiriensis TaxID=1050105 RepID=A0A919K980_9ACTN|nr:hypothetical protein Ari01nite_84870 [Actinoplanes rishiriensis]
MPSGITALAGEEIKIKAAAEAASAVVTSRAERDIDTSDS